MKKIISVLLSCTLFFTALVLPSSAENLELTYDYTDSSAEFKQFSQSDFSEVLTNTQFNEKTALKAVASRTIGCIGLTPTGEKYKLVKETTYRFSIDVYTTVTNTMRFGAAAQHWRLNTFSLPYFYQQQVVGKSEWQTISGQFVAKEDYFHLYFSGAATVVGDLYFANLKISPCYSLSAVSENTEQGTALVSAEKAAKGDTVTFTATPAAGCSFIGWYNESGSLVSADAEYKTEVTGDLALTAKFFPGVAQGFENFTGTTDDPFSIVEGTAGDTVHSGTKALKCVYNGGTKFLNLSSPTGYKYTTGEWYKVSVWVKPEKGAVGLTKINFPEFNSNVWSIKQDHRFLEFTSTTATEWKEYTFTFQAQYTNYGLWIDTYSNNPGKSTFYFDDLKIEKVSAESLRQTEVENAFTFIGTAIRTEGKQALRFKTTVDEKYLAENALTGGVTVAEYGFVVLNKDLLNGEELTLDSTYEKNGAIVTAPQKAAYNKENGTDIVFEKDGTLKTFTAALTGITGERYNTEYAVRVYVKLSNGEVHYAGETQYMSVYQCAALAFDAVGTTYTDTNGNSWKESYETRSYLFENILEGQTVDGKTYDTAPLAAQQ